MTNIRYGEEEGGDDDDVDAEEEEKSRIMRIWMKIGLVPLHRQANLQANPYNCQKKPFKISIQPLTL